MPVTPRRRAIAVYLTADELECVNRGAQASGLERSVFVRQVALYRAGWQGYSGPLFNYRSDCQRLEQHQVGDGLHDCLRTLRELGRTVCALYEKQAKPGPALLKLILGYARMLAGLEEELRALRHFNDSLELTFELEKIAAALAPHHGIVSGQLEQVAAAIIVALQRKEPTDGKQEQR